MKHIFEKIWNLFERCIRCILETFFKKINKSIDENQISAILQFIKFCIVGFSNTFLSYIIYTVLVYFGFKYIVANIIAFIISVLNSFYWNSKYVFKQSNNNIGNIVKTLIRTFIAYGSTGLLLSSLLLYLWIDIFNISKYIAPIINLLITIPLNFLINKYWAFKNKKF